jgi:hypothetical protein
MILLGLPHLLGNFEFIEQAAEHNDETHPVTQLALALLGLIVFQHEKNRKQFDAKVRGEKNSRPELASMECLKTQYHAWPICKTATSCRCPRWDTVLIEQPCFN